MWKLIAGLVTLSVALYQFLDRRRLLANADQRWGESRGMAPWMGEAPVRVFARVFYLGIVAELVFAGAMIVTA